MSTILVAQFDVAAVFFFFASLKTTSTYMNLLPANGSPTDRGLLTHRTHRQPDPGYK